MESRPRVPTRARLLIEPHGRNSSSMPRGCGNVRHTRQGPRPSAWCNVVQREIRGYGCVGALCVSATSCHLQATLLERCTGRAGRCKWLHRATKTVNAKSAVQQING
ncbi:hypothetical protein BDZ85DRAFT_127239 [Elsinoe ampelina]|uniref:Uncharacterized protein n=1 Tax=Elsinoe ampelina TaxID=302913 RepID=A0A6A6G9W5_9PEZI|nr:hypothetical protein BDZ85DRAFT_127239 [Elsinoe ampelina]